MSRKELFIGNFDFVFIALLAVLSLGVGASLLQPQVERHGVVEIYSLTSTDQNTGG